MANRIAICLLCCFHILSSTEINGINRAVCVLNPEEDSGVAGTVIFESEGSKTKISAEIKGLSPGQHAFGIHMLGDLSQGCKTTKDRYNPTENIHFNIVGDLGNIKADRDGLASFEMYDALVQLNGMNSIIGRSIVVHASADEDGERIACGVIGIGNRTKTC